MPGAGDLDRRITIQRYTSTTNDFNEEVKSWADLTTVWAMRRDASDGERVTAGKEGAFLMSRFTVRSSSKTRTVTPADRLSYDGAVWNIRGAKETQDGRKRFIEITATRKA